MQKVVEFLQKNSVQYLATVGRDGKAKCRPFMFCVVSTEPKLSVLLKTEHEWTAFCLSISSDCC